ncbi:MAG: hypothetical protein LBC83_01535 [Oscillospiraceae bacterium]|jgi:carboxyl-terminal processing protease|nr:hypothetical protein [Oscillospiraceae bacterium]
MNRKISLGVALALALVLVAASIPLTMVYARREQNRILANLPARAGLFASVGELEDVIEQSALERPNASLVAPELVRGFVAGLGDSRARYLSPEEYALYLKRLSGETADLGFELTYTPPQGVLVTSVRGTAAAAGLRIGDIVTQMEADNRIIFNGEASGQEDIELLLRKLESLGSGTGTTAAIPSINVTYEREKISHTSKIAFGDRVSTVYGSLLADGVGYVHVTALLKTTREQMREQIGKLIAQGANSLILDVRGCAEGTVAFACDALDLFISKSDVLATVAFREGRAPQSYRSTGSPVVTLPANSIAILLNHETDGASELFAYSMRSFGAAMLIGSASAGNGNSQEAFSLKETGGAVLLTTGRVTPGDKNESWCGDGENRGVLPDIAVGNPDLQQETARQQLIAAAAANMAG